MRQILETFGIGGYHGAGLSYIIFSLVLIVYFRKDLKNSLHAGNIYFLMFLESLFWAIIVYGMLLASQVFLSLGSGQRLLQQIVLSIGAGLYEELVFRVFLIHGIAKILEFLFKWEKVAQLTGAVIVSSVLFSGFHFVGAFGDIPSFSLFIARFVAGMVLGGIYVFRGFGIVAYTHSIYDLIILTQITQMN